MERGNSWRQHCVKWATRVRSLGDWGLDLLYPPCCITCSVSIECSTLLLCARCWEVIEGDALDRDEKDLGNAVVLGELAGPLREAIHALKFRGKCRLGRALGRRMGQMQLRRLSAVDGFIALPLHPARARERGYNQSLEIALGLAEVLDKPIVRGWVVRRKNTRQQARLNAEQRRENMRAAFVWRGIPPGRTWGLVDDVITTGATLEACIAAFPGAEADIVPIALAQATGDIS